MHLMDGVDSATADPVCIANEFIIVPQWRQKETLPSITSRIPIREWQKQAVRLIDGYRSDSCDITSVRQKLNQLEIIRCRCNRQRQVSNDWKLLIK